MNKSTKARELKTALILAGGKGTRMRPMTYKTPKPLIPVHGRPLIEHIFDLLGRHGVKDIIISVGYLKDKIMEKRDEWSGMGFDISFVEEGKALGTGGPLRLAKPKLTRTFVMSNGDELKNINITGMHEAHKRSRALATIALTTVEDPSQYGAVRLRGDRIVEFVEKPKKEESSTNMINAGLYILEPEVVDMIPEGFCSIEKEIFPELAKKGKLFGFPFRGQWFDTGTPERYERALKNWKGVRPGPRANI